MNDLESPYPGHRFPRKIASHAVWLYYQDFVKRLAPKGSFVKQAL